MTGWLGEDQIIMQAAIKHGIADYAEVIRLLRAMGGSELALARGYLMLRWEWVVE